MKKLQLIICTAFAIAGLASAGISTSPWSLSDKGAGWTVEDKDQEIAAGIHFEFLVFSGDASARFVVVSSPVVEEENALREFANGIQKSFAKNGVVDSKESTTTKWGFDGLGMAFSIPFEGARVNCDAFFFKDAGKFWAVFAFGSEQKELAKTFLILKNKKSKRARLSNPLPLVSRNAPLCSKPQPCCDAALSVARASARTINTDPLESPI